MSLAIVMLVLLVAVDPVGQAREAEEKAFAAVEEKRWCDALQLFVEADALSPSIDLALNAAQAADMGGDTARALSLYGAVLGRNPDGTQRTEVRKRIDALTRKMETDPAVGCQAPVAHAPAAQSPPPVEVASAATVLPTVRTPSAAASLSPWLAGGGAVVAVAGAIAFGIGARPYLLSEDAAAAIRADEAAGELADARARQNDLASASSDWQSWGQSTAVTGAVGVAVGTVVGVVGLALVLMEDAS